MIISTSGSSAHMVCSPEVKHHVRGTIAGICLGTLAIVAGIALVILGALSLNPIFWGAGVACIIAGLVTLGPCAAKFALMAQIGLVAAVMTGIFTGKKNVTIEF